MMHMYAPFKGSIRWILVILIWSTHISFLLVMGKRRHFPL